MKSKTEPLVGSAGFPAACQAGAAFMNARDLATLTSCLSRRNGGTVPRFSRCPSARRRPTGTRPSANQYSVEEGRHRADEHHRRDHQHRDQPVASLAPRIATATVTEAAMSVRRLVRGLRVGREPLFRLRVYIGGLGRWWFHAVFRQTSLESNTTSSREGRLPTTSTSARGRPDDPEQRHLPPLDHAQARHDARARGGGAGEAKVGDRGAGGDGPPDPPGSPPYRSGCGVRRRYGLISRQPLGNLCRRTSGSLSDGTITTSSPFFQSTGVATE